jgi:hypothetical protein
MYALGFSHVVKLKCLTRNRLAVFRKFVECATNHLDILGKLVFCFYKLEVEDRVPADFFGALQFVKERFSKSPITSEKKFTKSLKTLAGFDIKCNIEIQASHSYLLNVLNNQVPEVSRVH